MVGPVHKEWAYIRHVNAMTKTTKRWSSFWIVIAALLVSAALHWGWHLLEADGLRFGGTLEPTVTTCLPPFCDQPAQPDAEAVEQHATNYAYMPSRYAEPVAAMAYVEEVLGPDASTTPSLAGHSVHAATHKVCVYDLVGNAGTQVGVMSAWQQAALAQGSFQPELAVYTNANIALADFKAGVCQAAWLPGGLKDSVLPALDTLEAFGAVPSRAHADILLQVLFSEKGDTYYDGDDRHALMGLMFSGPAYLIFNTSTDGTSLPQRMSGRSMAVRNAAQHQFASTLGAAPIASTAENAAARFNNGIVEAIFTTLDMFEVLELGRGLEPASAIYPMPLFQSTYRLVATREDFSLEQLDWSSAFFQDVTAPQADKRIEVEQKELATWPVIQLSDTERAALSDLLRELRLSLRDNAQYDKGMLSLMRKARCKLDASLEECISPVE